jgi:threonine synthase
VNYISTRGGAPSVSFADALLSGIAPDGGLYVPDAWPALSAQDAAGAAARPYAETARQVLELFDAGSLPSNAIDAAVARYAAFHHAAVAPLTQLEPNLWLLELFWGPTAAFKDLAMQLMAPLADAALAARGERLLLLTATSGDTGAAAVRAFAGSERIGLVVFHPEGRVSPVQRRQMTTIEAPNVLNLAVRGDFDDCQRLVKAAFADPELAARHHLTSANSINVGRLLPQMAWHGWAAARVQAETGVAPGLIVPTGNLGHGFAALYARAMGLPIGPVLLATNANRTLADWAARGRYEPRPAVATIANAMDVGAPSNFERLAALDPGGVAVERVDDDAIRARIVADYRASGTVWCPHSATAAEAYVRLAPAARAERPWLLCATAHPYKFAEIVEPLIGRPIDPPPALAAILERPARALPIPATAAALAAVLAATAP